MTRKIRTTNAKVRSVAKPYEPTPGERLLMESHFARQAQTPAAPRLKVSDNSSGATEIAPDHPDPCMAQALLMEALATTDACFVVGLIGQLADAGTRRRKLDERELNFMLSVVNLALRDARAVAGATPMGAAHQKLARLRTRSGGALTTLTRSGGALTTQRDAALPAQISGAQTLGCWRRHAPRQESRDGVAHQAKRRPCR
jgi:hypothetical protein